MEYQTIINLLENAQNQPTKFRTKKWVEINGKSRVIYNTNRQIKFKTLMLRSRFCNYSDAYVLVSGTITVAEVVPDRRNNGIQVVFKNCTPFTNCISEINNTHIDNAKDVDVAMPVQNSIEYRDDYSKALGSLWQYYKDESALNDPGALAIFPGNSTLFKCQQKLTGSTGNYVTENVEIMVTLKYLSNFWRTLEITLINSEINLILTWSANCVISNATANKATKFEMTDTKLFVPVVTLSVDDNANYSNN